MRKATPIIHLLQWQNRMDEKGTDWTPDQDAAFEELETFQPHARDSGPEESRPNLINRSGAGPKAKYEELAAQLKLLNDKYLQLMADFENYKRRNARDSERLVDTANEGLIKEIIEVKENFERAFKSNVKGEKFVEGMKLNYAKLNSILQEYGLESYAEAGNEFTPELHDAVMSAPHDSIPDSHISNVHERGYTLKGKIIKHAKVVVSCGKPKGKSGKF
jgi:molecular chaperone GrpE